jgi:WD40 repeat protein
VGDGSTIIFSASFSPDGESLLAHNGRGWLIEARTAKLLSDFEEMDIVAAAFSPDGHFLALGSISTGSGIFSTNLSASATVAGTSHGNLYRHQAWPDSATSEWQRIQTSHQYDSQVYYGHPMMAASPNGRFLAVAFPDFFIEVWDSERDRVYSVTGIPEAYGAITTMLLTNHFLVAGGYDGRLIVFDLLEGSTAFVASVGERIPSFDLDPTGRYAVVRTESGTYAPVYDLYSGRMIYHLRAEPGDRIIDAAFMEDGSEVVAIEQSGRRIIGTLYASLESLVEYARTR